MIRIIVDSTCDLTDEFIKKHNIDVVPLQVIVNGVAYKDKFELAIETLYDHIREGDDIKTSLPNYDDIYPYFEKYAKSNETFIFFSFAKALSGTYNFAQLLVKDLKEQYKTDMAVVDLKNGGVASAMLMDKIVKYIETKPTFNEVVKYADEISLQMKHALLVEDLSQLRKGGRISTVKSLISGALSIKPILELVEGAIKSYKNAIGSKRGLNELLNFVPKFAPDTNTQIGVLYSANQKLREAFIEKLKQAGYKDIIQGQIASVMTAHIGLDAVSVCFIKN
jgi:DegV family protein with EDD domain